MWTLLWNSSKWHSRSFRKPFCNVFNKTQPKWIHRKQLKCFDFLLSKCDSLRVHTYVWVCSQSRQFHSWMWLWSLHDSLSIFSSRTINNAAKTWRVCWRFHCEMWTLWRNSSKHSFRKPFRHVFKIKIRPRRLQWKWNTYMKVFSSNYAEIQLVLTNHLSEIP